MTRNILLIISVCLLVLSCKQNKNENAFGPKVKVEALERGVYHWKTVFDLSSDEVDYIGRHGINRLYVRMFDVGMEMNEYNGSLEAVPLGTTIFRSKVPAGCTIVPTVFITQDALKAYAGREPMLAEQIVTRVKAMCSWNDLGKFGELQYDCDWTSGTRSSFERLCESTKQLLKEDGALLSGTIRLHQLEEAAYPFDRGVLMIYNTGSFVNPSTRNSILDYDDVSKYLSSEKRIRKFLQARATNCQQIDVAYPTFSWGVAFDSHGKFKKLIKDVDSYSPESGEQVRTERSDFGEVSKVKHLVDSLLHPAINGNIIYHLDSDNLKKYSSEEIEKIYN